MFPSNIASSSSHGQDEKENHGKFDSQGKESGRLRKRLAELHPVVRPTMRPFDLIVGDSSDSRESVDEASEFRLICAEADGPTKQTRTSRCRLLCPNSHT
jgi:hypothetical protein